MRDFLGGVSHYSARIERTADPSPTALQHVRVDHSRTDVLVPQEFLHCPNIVTVLQQGRCKAVPERMTATALGNACPDSFLENSFREMMAALNARTWINGAFRGWKDILPLPGLRGARVFVFEGVREVDFAIPLQHVCFVHQLHLREMAL